MMIVIGCLQIIAYGALLAIGFALGKGILSLSANILQFGKDKMVEWEVIRNNGTLSDLGLAG